MQLFHVLTTGTANAVFNALTLLLSAALLLNKRLAAGGFTLAPVTIAVLTVTAGLAVTAYGALIVLSQFVGYADHLQASVASVAWMSVHGFPVYPELDGDLYAMIYGPLLFWANAAVMRLVPGIASATIFSAAALVLGMAATWFVLRRPIGRGAAGLLLAALMVEQLIPYQFDGFWNRGEPFLYLIAALSLVAIAIRDDIWAILTIGLLAGLAADIKLTALFCTAPAAFIILARAGLWRQRLILVGYAALVGLAVLVLPVLIDPSVARLYTVSLPLASGHGLSGDLLRANLGFATAMMMPTLLPLMWRRPHLSNEDKWFFVGLLAALVLETVLGSKAGSGPYHLIPLLPWAAYGAVRAMTAPSNLDPSASSVRNQLVIVFAVLFVANLLLLVNAGEVLGIALDDLPAARAARAEFSAQLNAHPDAEFGAAGLPNYGLTYIRSLQVIRNNQLHLDIGAWMDLAEGGVDEAKARRFIENCQVPAWILPNGEPFSMISYYTTKPLFSDDFRVAFTRNYAVVEQGQYYTVWRCKGGEG